MRDAEQAICDVQRALRDAKQAPRDRERLIVKTRS